MNTADEPATDRYHTHVHAITRPDGTTTTRPDMIEPTVINARNEDNAAKLAAWAFIKTELPETPVGSTLHVHVFGPIRNQARRRTGHWTVNIYIDADAQTLH